RWAAAFRGWRTWGLGRGGGVTSSMGILKQKQDRCDLGLGRAILEGRLDPPPPAAAVPDCWGLDVLPDFSVDRRVSSPKRSASVSRLVRSSRMGVTDA